eukprot:354110-Prymnesium_polylepis.1
MAARYTCERVGLLGLRVCGLVSSPTVVPVRCLRAVNTVESSLRGKAVKGSDLTALCVMLMVQNTAHWVSLPTP